MVFSMVEKSDKIIRSVNENNRQFKVTIPRQLAIAMGIRDKSKVEFFIERGDLVIRKI